MQPLATLVTQLYIVWLALLRLWTRAHLVGSPLGRVVQQVNSVDRTLLIPSLLSPVPGPRQRQLHTKARSLLKQGPTVGLTVTLLLSRSTTVDINALTWVVAELFRRRRTLSGILLLCSILVWTVLLTLRPIQVTWLV